MEKLEGTSTARPLIGITARHAPTIAGLPAVQILQAYVSAVVDAGGTPILIPPDLPEDGWRSLLNKLDGILFSGGSDIGLDYFDGEPHPKVVVESIRDAIELPLLRTAVESNIPVLGICRGLQVMNVALGGSLFTHIIDQYPNALQHDMPDELPRTHLAHPVHIVSGTRLFEILCTPLAQVNSLHHQGIKELAPGLVATAYAPDGLVEGVEIPGHRFAVSVQWHPEWMTSYPEMRNLFRAFTRAASRTA